MIRGLLTFIGAIGVCAALVAPAGSPVAALPVASGTDRALGSDQPWQLELIFLDPSNAVVAVDHLTVADGERCTAETTSSCSSRGARYGFTIEHDAQLGCWTSL